MGREAGFEMTARTLSVQLRHVLPVLLQYAFHDHMSMGENHKVDTFAAPTRLKVDKGITKYQT